MTRLSGWGRYPVADCLEVELTTPDQACNMRAPAGAIARGNGRSYGDSSLAPAGTMMTRRLDRMLAFDEASGQLTCEAGTMLSDIITAFVPRGWFPPVTPGTKFVTVGGMVAADVHGKNHHGAGSFCNHVLWLDLALGDGRVLHCSPAQHAELFAATCGGMGLTGIILRVCFTLRRIGSAWIEQRVERAGNLDQAMALFEASQGATYSVAWIDCLATGSDLGRSVVFLGEHAPRATGARGQGSIPKGPGCAVRFAAGCAQPFLGRLFNELYYRRQTPRSGLVGWDPYFYPLDSLLDWNRIYGRAGFVQYQCVLPLTASRAGLTELLRASAQEGSASFLAVIKRMGPGSFGYLSFPMEGYTLALDFPVRPPTLRLLDRFDAIVAAHGGRLYLAKDARTSPQMIEVGYPKLTAFREVRRHYGLDERFRSTQSARLGL